MEPIKPLSLKPLPIQQLTIDLREEVAEQQLLQRQPTQRLEPSPAELLVQHKNREYARASRVYRRLYYTLRVAAGLSAGLLPFVVATFPIAATTLSVIIVVATVLDMVFNPKDRWQLFSRASDALTLERFKHSGDDKGYETLLAFLVAMESAKLDNLVSLQDVMKKAKDAGSSA